MNKLKKTTVLLCLLFAVLAEVKSLWICLGLIGFLLIRVRLVASSDVGCFIAFVR